MLDGHAKCSTACMRLPILLVSALTLFAPTALAFEPLSVIVTVYGEGTIRVLLTAGATVPCDSTSNTVMLDGKLEAGRSYGFQSPELSVCERHTRGTLREVDWSNDRLWALRGVRGFPPPDHLEVVNATNR